MKRLVLFLRDQMLSILLAVFLAVLVTYLIVYAPRIRLGEETRPERAAEGR